MYWSQVEIAQRMEWPQTSEEHMALVRGISSHEWLSCLRESDMGMLLDEDDWPIAPIADLELETRYGPRRFHVWKPPGHDAILIAKRRSQEHMVVTCALTAFEGEIEASFFLLSGECLGKTVFEVSPFQQELFVANLKQAAFELAVEQNNIESKHQQLQVVLSGCGGVLPDEVLVWEGAVVTQDALDGGAAAAADQHDAVRERMRTREKTCRGL